ncbi:MAG: putative zinc-binding metallopeptidase [Proteobacteria bacterium]|jgi:hypothetical protein|nr:putative zinc-binding metallopeptidase [Pseudomonadota bacterium]
MKSFILKHAKKQPWENDSDERLLQRSLKEVYVPIQDTGLQPYIDKLHAELKHKGLDRFAPSCYFSNEFFVADGYASIAIPFYLSHPRLVKLEKDHLHEVEGGTPQWFMQLLRHECGHAIDSAYGLRKRKRRQQLFGKSSTPYDDYYVPKPYSKKYVIHLDTWYAQSHPDEDFAETFAVWLNSRDTWKKRYKDWKVAYQKLQYMDELMLEISSEKPKITSKKLCDPQQKLTTTLKQHYQEKEAYYGLSFPKIYDVHLFKLFTNNPKYAKKIKASDFIKKVRRETGRAVARWTGTFQYNIHQLMDEIIEQSDLMDLYLRYNFEETKNQFVSMITLVTLEYIHSGNHKKAR